MSELTSESDLSQYELKEWWRWGGLRGVTLVGGVAFNYPDRSIPSDTRSMLIRGDRDERIPPNSGLALSLLSPLSSHFSLSIVCREAAASPIPALTHVDSRARAAPAPEEQRGSGWFGGGAEACCRGCLRPAPRGHLFAALAPPPHSPPPPQKPPGPRSAMHNAGVKMLTVANKNQRGCPHKSEQFRSTFHLRAHRGDEELQLIVAFERRSGP